MTDKFRPQLEYNLPLSGAVSVPITMPSFSGAQFGLFNINLGGSGDPALEQEMLDQVGSYGRQLGRICEVMEVMLDHMESSKPIDPKSKAVTVFREMAAAIRHTKSGHKKPG